MRRRSRDPIRPRRHPSGATCSPCKRSQHVPARKRPRRMLARRAARFGAAARPKATPRSRAGRMQRWSRKDEELATDNCASSTSCGWPWTPRKCRSGTFWTTSSGVWFQVRRGAGSRLNRPCSPRSSYALRQRLGTIFEERGVAIASPTTDETAGKSLESSDPSTIGALPFFEIVSTQTTGSTSEKDRDDGIEELLGDLDAEADDDG